MGVGVGVGVGPSGVGVAVGVGGGVAPPVVITSKASIHTQFPPEAGFRVPVTSTASVCEPYGRPVTEYTTACAREGVW